MDKRLPSPGPGQVENRPDLDLEGSGKGGFTGGLCPLEALFLSVGFGVCRLGYNNGFCFAYGVHMESGFFRSENYRKSGYFRRLAPCELGKPTEGHWMVPPKPAASK
jgi:hypothetical protein